MPRPKFGKIGTARRDMRFRAPDGSEWDSRFEWLVYDGYLRSDDGRKVRRTVKGSGDTFSYSVPIGHATCSSCGSAAVSKQRHYTPDFVSDAAGAPGDEGAYFIETKGYLRAAERSLLRAFCKARGDVALRVIYQRDFPVSKTSSITQWTAKFLKIPHAVWQGKCPVNWIMPTGKKK